MSQHTDDGEYGRSGARKPADNDGDGALGVDRPRIRLLDRIAYTCTDLVNGVLLASSELDVDGELINLGTASKVESKWTAALASGIGRYWIQRGSYKRARAQMIETPSDQSNKKHVKPDQLIGK